MPRRVLRGGGRLPHARRPCRRRGARGPLRARHDHGHRALQGPGRLPRAAARGAALGWVQPPCTGAQSGSAVAKHMLGVWRGPACRTCCVLRVGHGGAAPAAAERARAHGPPAGATAAAVVGTRLPRFSLFGDSVDMAFLMEASSRCAAVGRHAAVSAKSRCGGEAWSRAMPVASLPSRLAALPNGQRSGPCDAHSKPGRPVLASRPVPPTLTGPCPSTCRRPPRSC
jgi:hypothetical protein